MDPTYSLAVVDALLREGRYRMTGTAAFAARAIDLDATDMLDCIRALTRTDFHKTMPSNAVRGLWQDVYRPTWCGTALYVKLQIADQHPQDVVLVIVSFKEKYSWPGRAHSRAARAVVAGGLLSPVAIRPIRERSGERRPRTSSQAR